jgi:hypothetical protein
MQNGAVCPAGVLSPAFAKAFHLKASKQNSMLGKASTLMRGWLWICATG